MARKTLQPSLETYEKLGNAWLAAREYDAAIEPLQRASDLARDGRIGVRIAEVHLQRKDWPAAAEAAQRAIAKGGLKSPAAAELVLGIALYNQNELDAAREAFERAARGPEQRKYARSYLQSIDARQGRL